MVWRVYAMYGSTILWLEVISSIVLFQTASLVTTKIWVELTRGSSPDTASPSAGWNIHALNLEVQRESKAVQHKWASGILFECSFHRKFDRIYALLYRSSRGRVTCSPQHDRLVSVAARTRNFETLMLLARNTILYFFIQIQLFLNRNIVPCMESGFRNPGTFWLWNPECWALDPEYSLRSPDPTNDWNPACKIPQWTKNPESSNWNPETKGAESTIRDSLRLPYMRRGITCIFCSGGGFFLIRS